MSKKEYPIPAGYTWNHEFAEYMSTDKRVIWNDKTNEFRNAADGGLIPQVDGKSIGAGVGTRIDAASDERVVNNGSNTMRSTYRVLDDAEKAHMHAIKSKGEELLQVIKNLGTSRELSLAATNLEQAVMWAVKHITK